MQPDAPALDIQDLRFRYDSAPGAPDVISIDSLNVNRGEQLLLTAQSGAGKSTLLQLVSGLMEPTSGRVKVLGTDLHGLRGSKRDAFRGRHIGMVFQSFHLLHGFTAKENVLTALMFSDRRRTEHDQHAAELLAELEIERPDAEVGELSIGQQQRVAVARAMACEPSLVLADEPTASLDPERAATAVTLMQRVCEKRGAALICVSHDPAMGERFERRESLEPLGEAANAASQTGGGAS